VKSLTKKAIKERGCYGLSVGVVSDNFSHFVVGLLTTLGLTLSSLLVGLVFGLILALMKISTNWILKGISIAYIELIRGTPALMQIMLVYLACLPWASILTG